MLLSWKQCHRHSYLVSSPWVLPLASLRSESYMMLFEEHVVVMEAWSGHGNDVYNMHAYQVSSTCVPPLASLRSEELIFKKIAWGYLLLFKQSGCHGNDVTRMRTKFHLHACYTVSKFEEWRSRFKDNCLRLFANNMRSSWKYVIVMEMIK